MKNHVTLLSLALAFTLNGYSQQLPLEKATLEGDENISTPYGSVELEHNFVNKGSDELFNAMDFQRASQAYIWSTPMVSFKTWQKELASEYGATELGDFAVLKSLKEKRGVVTGNLTTPYIISFKSLKDGPIKVKVPRGEMAGMLLDFWQRPISDIGQTGPDQGKGGTYIIVGPDEKLETYKGKADFVYQSVTNNIFIGIRLLDNSPAFEKEVEQTMKIGRVNGKFESINFIKGVDKEWSATAPRGLDYWEYLSEIYQDEPVRDQDKVWSAMLEPLGIKKGEDFNPDARQREILLKGSAMGELMIRNLQTNPRYTKPYWEGTEWFKSFDFTLSQSTDYKVELDERAVWYYEAVTSTDGMVNPSPGKGQVYMTSKRDNKGNLLRADKTYKLHVPKDVPVKQFWSVTLYSENTRRPYDNGGSKITDVSLGSRTESLQVNDDGSVDLYIGANAPKGKESNYLKTVGEDGWFTYFRLYAPTERFFDKSFTLPDWESID